MTFKKWVKKLIFSSLILLFSIIAFNIVIDSNGIFNLVNIEKFNKVKNYTLSDTRSKFYNAQSANPEVLLMGTSRTENINPKYLSKYLNGRIYNLSLKGSGVTQHKRNIEYFIKNSKIKYIVYGLDFFSFNPEANNYTENIMKTRYDDYYIDDYLDVIFGIKTFEKSIKTLKSNMKLDKPNIFLENGWASNYDNIKEIKKKGVDKVTKETIYKKLFQDKKQFNNEEFKNMHSIDKSLKVLDDIVQICKKNNVKLYLFTSPVYSKINTLIEKRGYGDTYNYWKKALSKYEEVYDFNGYNTITNDINNFYDGHHYVDEISKLILARIFNDTEVVVPKDFGSIIKEK